LWKSVETSSAHPLADPRPVNRGVVPVNLAQLSDGLEKFTSFLIMNILGKPLSSTETIAKLVEKPVQIPVRLAQFRNLINRV
jgi:hypothetical protein